MALADLLYSSSSKKQGMSEERVRKVIPELRKYIAFWREYPDLFIDFLLEIGNPQNFEFFFYQRVFLRAAARHQYMYSVFPRAWMRQTNGQIL